VDYLDQDAKLSLQVASILAPTFQADLLQLCVPGVDLDSVLRVLVERGLLMGDGEEREGRYAFATHFIWEVVRGSVLGSQLREQHFRVSEGIEQRYEGHLEAHFESLAGHCAAGGRLLDAARYSELAGDGHRLMGLIERSMECYEHGIDVLEQVVDPSAESMRLEGLATLYLKLGRVTAMLGMQDKAAKNLQLAQEISADILVPDLEVGCIVELGRLYTAQGKMDLARVVLEHGLSEARLAGLGRQRAELLLCMGDLGLEEGKSADALEHFEKALGAADGESDLVASAFIGLANVHNRTGEIDLAMASLGQARVLAEDSGDALLQARIVNNMGNSFFANGDYIAALASFREALEFNQGAGYRRGAVYNLHNIGDVLFRQDEFSRAYAAFDQARQIAKEYGLVREVAFNEIYLGYLLAQQGEWEEGVDMLEQGIEVAGKHSDVESVLMGRWLEGKLLASAGRADEGRVILEQALKDAIATEIVWVMRDIQTELGRL
jgi:tetratricopeptide (TPR) repeat protein